MIIQSHNLFKRDNKDKIRHVQIYLNEHKTVDNEIFYSITGKTGIYNGTMTSRPVVTIDRGKVKRTVKEQAELQYNSLLSSYLDKGYKTSEDIGIIDCTDKDDVESKVPKLNTDQHGNLKPMLALSWEGIKDNLWKKPWLASAKLDGTRCLMYYNAKEDRIYTSSRGGKNYDVPATYICRQPQLHTFFKANPDLVLDGELYIHGRPLSYISGLVRLQELSDKHYELRYYVYDIADEKHKFTDRLTKLKELQSTLKVNDNLSSYTVVVQHHQVSSKEEIIQLHNEFVNQGYEGLVIRDPEQVYKCGARDKRMIKVKMFQDAEFEITGITDGLREEDFVFNMKTKEGYPFEAKPMGDRALKKWYREHIKQLIGKLATVKFFGYTTTDKPVPNLPVMKALRDQIDM